MTEWMKYMGSQIDSGILEESALAMAQSTIQNAINQAGISRADLARNMECGRSFISRMLTGNHNLTIRTMARALASCGFEVRFERVPVVWNWGTEAVQPCEQALSVNTGSAGSTIHHMVGLAVSVCHA
jgi:transcriptional regulator with XRE-family HTH domain